jgi:Na+/proline symporter
VVVLFRFYILAAVMCAVSLLILMMSPAEREKFFLTRWFMKRFLSRMDFLRRHERISQVCGVIFTVFAVGAAVAFLIVRLNKR